MCRPERFFVRSLDVKNRPASPHGHPASFAAAAAGRVVYCSLVPICSGIYSYLGTTNCQQPALTMSIQKVCCCMLRNTDFSSGSQRQRRATTTSNISVMACAAIEVDSILCKQLVVIQNIETARTVEHQAPKMATHQKPSFLEKPVVWVWFMSPPLTWSTRW